MTLKVVVVPAEPMPALDAWVASYAEAILRAEGIAVSTPEQLAA